MIKTRSIQPMYSILGREYDRNLNRNTWYGPTQDCFRVETTDSTNNHNWKQSGDSFSGFTHRVSEGRSYASGATHVSASSGGSNPFLSYYGRFVCGMPSLPTLVGDGELWAASAYSRMKPTKPVNPLFNMVYELKDLAGMARSLNHFWEIRWDQLRQEVASRFLEHQFGWKPLVDDVMSLVESQAKISKRIEWLIRNNGKWTSRRVTMLDSQSQTDTDWVQDWGSISPIMTTSYYYTVPRYRETHFVKDKVWATAQFKYFLPDVPLGKDPRFVLKRALQGNYVSIDQIYRAIPWSWLTDWALNLATVLENTGAGVADRIAARRFYVMREQEQIKIRRASCTMRGFGGASSVSVDCSAWRRELYQTRIVGSPFYPGNPNQLSDMQYAILGALGASRY